jgi:acyl-CoA thioesterase I
MGSMKGLMVAQRMLLAVALVACGQGSGGASAVADTAVTKGPGGAGSSSAAPSQGTPQGGGGGAAGRILFLGTSLTAGLGLDPDSAYPQRVQRRIEAAGLPYVVTNAGVSGETSAGLLRRLDWVLQQPADVIVVETGANDGLRGQSVEATRATIAQILDRIRRERPDARVVLAQMEAPPNFGAWYTEAFHAMYPALATEKGVTLLPFLLEGVAGHPSLNQADGIHPNDAGERLVAETVWKGIEPVLRGRARNQESGIRN